MANWKQVESLEKPSSIDNVSSAGGIYIRRDIREVEIENQNGELGIKYVYQEAFLSQAEYESYKIKQTAAEVNGESNSSAYEHYKEKLENPVQYPKNGLYYKPSYCAVYEEYINKIGGVLTAAEKFGKDITPILSQTYAVFDATEKAENMRLMTGGEVIDLYFFLLGLKEAYFAEYKAEKIGE